ncbi:tRNA-dihydrouridine synthase, partial [uncultured Holdemanella sp.]
MIKIGNVEIDNPVVIAPMAGISNIAFRRIAKRFGAGLVCNEMVSDKALYYDSLKTKQMCVIDENEHPVSFQLFGHDIDTVVYAAKYLDTQTNCDIIDFNMGCPVNKVIKAQAGSFLMKDIDYAKELVSNIVQNVNKPVTVKMRLGFDTYHINCVEMAKA